MMIIVLFLGAHSAAGIDAHPEHPGLLGGAGRHAVLQGPWAGPSRSSRSFRSFPSRLSPRVHHCCCSPGCPGCPGLSGCLLALLALIVRVTFFTVYTIRLVLFYLIATRIVAPNNKRTCIYIIVLHTTLTGHASDIYSHISSACFPALPHKFPYLGHSYYDQEQITNLRNTSYARCH